MVNFNHLISSVIVNCNHLISSVIVNCNHLISSVIVNFNHLISSVIIRGQLYSNCSFGEVYRRLYGRKFPFTAEP